MTHLRIEQTNGIETVSRQLIQKLYQLAYAGLDSSSVLSGTLHVTSTYQDYVTFLQNQFSDLHILADAYYARIDDPEAERVLVQQYSSDGVGLIQSDINQITSLSNLFDGNTSVQDLSCLSQLTNVTSIGSNLCKGATSLTTVTLPSGVTQIPGSPSGANGGAFNGCTNLTTVILPDNLTSIGNYSFYGDTSLSQINFPTGLTSIGWFAFQNTNLSSITIPNSVTNIGNGTFRGCTNLSSITFSDGGSTTLSIAAGAGFAPGFIYGCTNNLVVTFPNKTITIAKKALSCANSGSVMTTYIFTSTTPPTVTDQISEENNAFKTRMTIYVPDSAVNDYKTATGFTYFADCIHSINDYIAS